MQIKAVTYRDFYPVAALSLAWALSVWSGNREEFTLLESYAFILHVLLVFALQFFLLGVAGIMAKKLPLVSKPFVLLAPVFCTFNFYTLVLLDNETFAAWDTLYHVLISIGLVAFFGFIFYMMSQTQTVSKFIYGVAVLFIVQTALIGMWNQYELSTLVKRISKLPEYVSYPEFVDTPNVYIIGFDALMPPAMTDKFFGLKEPAYLAVLKSQDTRIVKNAFADYVPTNRFWNTLVAMDEQLFLKEKKATVLFDTGERPSPLYEVFKKNGYKIAFLYKSSFFGPKEKSPLDYYLIAKEEGICEHAESGYSLMGFCLETLEEKRVAIFKMHDKPYPQELYNWIETKGKSGEKWLTLAYIFSPGHTAKKHNVNDPKSVEQYKQEYTNKRSETAAKYIDGLFQAIRTYDPTAIVVVAGDHGSFFTRPLDPDKKTENAPYGEKEIFQDRQAVMMAVYPSTFCPEEFGKNPYGHMRIGRSIIKCLSHGKDLFPAEFQPDDSKFEAYLYE